MSYSADLQLNLTATGNPYHAIAASLPETNTETPIHSRVVAKAGGVRRTD